MLLKNRKELFEFISDKEVIIWGARMTGIGALRQLTKQNIKIIDFVDSDLSLVGKNVHGFEVHHPSDLKKILDLHEKAIILVAVSLKEEEILSQFQKMDIKNIPVKVFMTKWLPIIL